MRNRQPSLRKLYRNIILFLIPVVIFTGILFMHVRSAILKQVLNSNHSDIKKEISDLEDICSNVNYALIQMLDSNEQIQVLMEENDKVRRNVAIFELQTDFKIRHDESRGICNYFFYDMNKSTLVYPLRENVNIRTEYAIRDEICRQMELGLVDASTISKKWTLDLMEEEKNSFIIKLYRNQDYFIGCWIPVDVIFRDFGVNEYSMANRMMMFEQYGQIETGMDRYKEIAKTDGLIVDAKKRSKVKGNYELSWYPFEKGEFSFVFCINILDNFQIVQNTLFLLIGISIFIFISGIVLLIYVQKNLLRPMSYFVNHLSVEYLLKQSKNAYSAQDSDGKVFTPYFKEMAQVDSMVKEAAAQIVDLKFAMYENEMEKNQIEMDYLQQQIKPHFYLNCMNIIYSMAQFGKMEEIKSFSLEIVEYLRGIFRCSSDKIILHKEIDHVKKYLDINATRYEDEFETEIKIEEGLEDCYIIPLLIHTLVENSIKHALFGSQILKICIEVERQSDEKENYIHICVHDNGTGFPDNVLQSLNNGEKLTSKDGKRVGLGNTARRIRFFYQGKARLAFSNKETGGAMSEIWIPEEHMESEIK